MLLDVSTSLFNSIWFTIKINDVKTSYNIKSIFISSIFIQLNHIELNNDVETSNNIKSIFISNEGFINLSKAYLFPMKDLFM
jgi:hypothetical protein